MEPRTGQPLTLDPHDYPCECCVNHNPNPRRTHRHHIVPLAWGGPDQPANVIPLCPTTHDHIHMILMQWHHGTRQPGEYPRWTPLYVRDLCRRAWEGRNE